MYKQPPNFEVMEKRAELQRERYETRIQLLNQQIEALQKTIKEQQDTIGKLNNELKYKNTLIERMNSYSNIPQIEDTTTTKQSFFKRIFHKNDNS